MAGAQGAHARPPDTGTVVFSQLDRHLRVTTMIVEPSSIDLPAQDYKLG